MNYVVVYIIDINTQVYHVIYPQAMVIINWLDNVILKKELWSTLAEASLNITIHATLSVQFSLTENYILYNTGHLIS